MANPETLEDILNRLKYPIDLDGLKVPEAASLIREHFAGKLPKKREVDKYDYESAQYDSGWNDCQEISEQAIREGEEG